MARYDVMKESKNGDDEGEVFVSCETSEEANRIASEEGAKEENREHNFFVHTDQQN
ncbi:MAG: hypothetical protein ABI857_13540 [Acidobacteriota bacterium]